MPETPAPGRGRLSPRNWRVPTRLNAIMLIPVLVALVFGGFRVESSVSTWQDAQDAERTARLVRAAAAYGHALVDERDVTAEPLLTGTDDETVRKARAATDAAAAEFDRRAEDMPHTASLERRLKAFRAVEPQLVALRRDAYTSRLDGVKTEEGYVTVQHPLMELANELGLGTGNITTYGRSMYAISLAKAAASLQRSIGIHLLVKPGPSEADRTAQVTAFGSYAYLENIALAEFDSGGTPDDVSRLETALEGTKKTTEEQLAAAKQKAEADGEKFVTPPSLPGMVQSIGAGTTPARLADRGITPETWLLASTAKFDAYRGVEKHLADKAVDEAARVSSDARRDAFVNSAIVLLALLAAFVVAGMMARSMSRSMRQLRSAAFEVAEQRLPLMVDQLSRADAGRVDTRVRPIPIATRDEIGEIARAFDQVHREAVRLAAEQAMLRGNVNAIFTNLSARNQGLIERQLSLISELESREADPDQLEHLFRLDHLATRMRRNGENLLILAGEEPGRRWNQPIPLVDVLRAASSEVESYERIEVSGVPDTEIHGTAVTDLVHLLSELLENATSFSSPQTKVRVTATRLPDSRIMIEIHDKGIGLTAEDFADINHKLATPPTVDATISQRMGLFVVGRLAGRHGIRVQLRPSGEQTGTTSLVMLPEAITHGGGGADQPGGGYPDAHAVPAAPAQAALTASPTPIAPLDPVRPRGSIQPLDPAAPFGTGAGQLGRAVPSGYERPQLESSAYQANGWDDQPSGYQEQQLGLGGQQPADYPHQPSGYTQPEADWIGSDEPRQQPATAFNPPIQQGGWNETGVYDPSFEPAYKPQPESAPGAPEVPRDGVEFPRPDLPPASAGGSPTPDSSAGVPSRAQAGAGSVPDDSHSLTGAGLPRRGKQWPSPGGQEAPGAGGAQDGTGKPTAAATVTPGAPKPLLASATGDPEAPSANDERWRRAGALREPKAGGVTPSGLPRRVPKANLVEGSAEQSAEGGPQVSRAPEAVRGRLSNLRRGVQQGRSAGAEFSARDQQDQQGFGPGSSYDQER